MRAARLLGWLALLLAMLGWSAWFVICNVYEFAPDLDVWAFAYGWVLSVLVAARTRRVEHGRAAWLPLLAAACIGGYLLLIHQGMGAGLALALLLISSLLAYAATRPSAHL